jgi:hypothetical protein
MNQNTTQKQPSHWQAGLASVDITPEEPIWLAGWGNRTTPSIGVSTPIHAKALALKFQDGPISILVGSDLMAYSVEFVEAVVKTAKQRFGIERSRLILCASHSHSAPVTTNVLPLYYTLNDQQQDVIRRYSDSLHDKFIDAIAKAIDDLKPATLEFGNNMAGFAINRRRSRPGGQAWPNAVDQDVPVLCVRGLDRQVRGIVFGYACHTTCIQNDRVNGDYAGFAQLELEKLYPGAVAIFINGCGGDQGPHPRFHEGLGETYGHILALAVHDLVRGRNCLPTQPVEGPLNAASGIAELKFDPRPSRQEFQVMLPGRQGMALREVQNQLDRIDAGLPPDSDYPYALQVWRFASGQTFVIMSSEVVIDYQIRFKQTYGVTSTWVMAYANEHIAYIPSRRVREEGGYEGTIGMLECGFSAPFTTNVEQTIADTVQTLWQKAEPK